MSLLAMAVPILPGKMEQWRSFVGELNGARREQFAASRQRMQVHERTFLQPTPMGDLVIVTLEGADPAEAMRRFVSVDDEFTRWFIQQVVEIHGLDLTRIADAPPPELVIDSDRRVGLRAA